MQSLAAHASAKPSFGRYGAYKNRQHNMKHFNERRNVKDWIRIAVINVSVISNYSSNLGCYKAIKMQVILYILVKNFYVAA